MSQISPYNVKQGQPYQPPTKGYTVAGAITQLQGGYASIRGVAAIAMTLAIPSLDNDGVELVIVARTAQAHTITTTSVGFNAGGASKDVATFDGTIGANLVLRADQGAWIIISSVGVTLS